MGACVYDSTHKTLRGWGRITAAAAADPDDGIPRWHVDFERGKRACAIKQSYLALPCMHRYDCVAPAAVGQRIKVVVGEHSGKEGVTAAFKFIQACTQPPLPAALPLATSILLSRQPVNDPYPPLLRRASPAGPASLMAPTVR